MSWQPEPANVRTVEVQCGSPRVEDGGGGDATTNTTTVNTDRDTFRVSFEGRLDNSLSNNVSNQLSEARDEALKAVSPPLSPVPLARKVTEVPRSAAKLPSLQGHNLVWS